MNNTKSTKYGYISERNRLSYKTLTVDKDNNSLRFLLLLLLLRPFERAVVSHSLNTIHSTINIFSYIFHIYFSAHSLFTHTHTHTFCLRIESIALIVRVLLISGFNFFSLYFLSLWSCANILSLG